MNPSRHLLDGMLKSLQDRNIFQFHACLSYGFDVRCFVTSSSGQIEPFIVRVARSSFPEALRVLLIGTSPCPIDPNHGVMAFNAAITTGAPKSVIGVFVEASLLGTFPILSVSEAFLFSVMYSCETLARLAIERPEFNARWRFVLSSGGWDHPVHVAARYKQPEVIRRLLELGSDVDSPNFSRETALKIAVEQADFDSVFVLLEYGADPNAPDELRPFPAERGALLGEYGIPEYPAFFSQKTRHSLTDGADRIIRILREAGFRPTSRYWIRDTWVNKHLSKAMGQLLFDSVRQLPSMLESSVSSGRQAVRQLMIGRGGTKFNDFVRSLLLPNLMKTQLFIDLTR